MTRGSYECARPALPSIQQPRYIRDDARTTQFSSVRPTALNSLYLLFYRAYLALKKSVIVPVFRRWPQGLTRFNDAKNFLKRRALPSRTAWMQVQSGFAQGLWMRLRIPEEAGFWRGVHEPGVQSAFSALLRPGDVVYDVGAHLGSLALGAARLVGASGRVVAFDGDPENVERLRENSSRNHLNSRVQVVHAAVWSHRSASGISFRRGKSLPSQGGVESDGQRPVLGDGEIISVPVTTLDDFVAAGGPVPQLVKIDVEGGEYEVLRGGASLFANQRPLLLVEVHHQQAADNIGAWLSEFRYSAEWRIPPEKFPRYLIAWPLEHAAPALLDPDVTQ
jgi:FkbM family methyltransferase